MGKLGQLSQSVQRGQPGQQQVQPAPQTEPKQKDRLQPAPIANSRQNSAKITLNSRQKPALIPGSSVTSQAAVSAFRTRHACLANHGAWRLDPVPRLLPWTAPSSSGWGGWQCDVAWTVNASAMSASDGGGKATVDVSTSGGGHVAWGAADKVVLQGLPAGDWRVRQAVKYRWLPHRTCGRWEDVGNSKIAELLNGKRMLIVGDSISGMLFFSLRNHLMQNFSVPEAAQEAAAAADTEGSEKLPVWDVVPDFCKASWQHGLRW
ncbi:unnamed protein product [Closterium sp. NIES-53]